MLTEQVKAQVRWLAENPGAPDAVPAAMALADEITALSLGDDRYVSRATLEHERQAVLAGLKALWSQVIFNPVGADAMTATLRALGVRRPPPFVVSVDDPDRLSPDGRCAAEEAVLAALARLGWDINLLRRVENFHNRYYVYATLTLTPPPEFWRHLFDRDRVCTRCRRPELVLLATDDRTCPGSPPAAQSNQGNPTDDPDPRTPD